MHPMNKPDMFMIYYGFVTLYTQETADYYEEAKLWRIENTEHGYRFVNLDDTSMVLCLYELVGGDKMVSCFTDSGEVNCRWYLIPVANASYDAYFYDTVNNSLVGISLVKTVMSGEACSIESLGYIPVSCSRNGASQVFEWVSSNPSIVSVNEITGTFRGVMPGHAYITGTNLDGEELTISVTVTLNNGVYSLRNKYSNKYMQTVTDSANVTEATYAVGKEQKWLFEAIEDGYYTIRSVYDDNYYLGVNEDSISSGELVILRTNTITEGMKWKITCTESGAYRLIPKSGEEYDCTLSRRGLTIANNVAIIQTYYTDDNNFSDEWILTSFESAYLYGVPDDDSDDENPNEWHEHEAVLHNVADKFCETDGTYSHIYHGDADPFQFKNHLQSANILVTRSHGYIRSDRSGEELAVSILLEDVIGNASYGAMSFHSNFFGDSDAVYIADEDDLSNLDLVIFMGCHTGYWGEYGVNFPSRAVECGARVAIGFRNEIRCGSANAWLETFFDQLCQGESVADAAKHASENCPGPSLSTDEVVICGDKDAILFD